MQRPIVHDANHFINSAVIMKSLPQMILVVFFLHSSSSLASEIKDEVPDPLDFDYDVSSQTMKNRDKDVKILLEECTKNLEAERNVGGIVSDALEELKLSNQDCLRKFTSLQEEKHQLEKILQEAKIVQQELKNAVNDLESQNKDLKQSTLSLSSEVGELKKKVDSWQKELKNAVNDLESQNKDLKQSTLSLSSEVVELKKKVDNWQKVCKGLITFVLGAVIVIALKQWIIQRAAVPQLDVPEQQNEALQQGPPHEDNMLYQEPAHQEDAAPMQDIPEEHLLQQPAHPEDAPHLQNMLEEQHPDLDGHESGSHRGRNLVDPSCPMGANPLEGIVQEVEEIPAGNEERDFGDPCCQLNEMYQTASRNADFESSLAVQPSD